MTNPLVRKRCLPCEGGIPPLDHAAAETHLKQLAPRWQLVSQDRAIEARFEFKNYFRNLAFVNAVAYIAIQEDHHPEIEFAYKTCRIRYRTTAINGLSENDFICAAKIDRLIDEA